MSNIFIRGYRLDDKDQVKSVVLSAMRDIRPGYYLESEERNRDLDNIPDANGGKGKFCVLTPFRCSGFSRQAK